jgi:hypothetical protein
VPQMKEALTLDTKEKKTGDADQGMLVAALHWTAVSYSALSYFTLSCATLHCIRLHCIPLSPIPPTSIPSLLFYPFHIHPSLPLHSLPSLSSPSHPIRVLSGYEWGAQSAHPLLWNLTGTSPHARITHRNVCIPP